jgi:hypothetical protein
VVRKLKLFYIPFGFVAAFAGCNGGDGANAVSGVSIPGVGMPEAHADTSQSAVVGDTCKAGDSNHLCLALKYVGYKADDGTPTVSQNDAISNVKQINKLWNQCDLGFQIENYSAINPKDSGLKYNTANTSELDDIRKAESSDTALVVVTTGTWDRSGSLGDTPANAWTAMPGESLYGAILEKPVGTFGNIVAHELGHYVGLDHVSDESDLMNPVIYDSSTQLTKDQCSTARTTVASYWQKMER